MDRICKLCNAICRERSPHMARPHQWPRLPLRAGSGAVTGLEFLDKYATSEGCAYYGSTENRALSRRFFGLIGEMRVLLHSRNQRGPTSAVSSPWRSLHRNPGMKRAETRDSGMSLVWGSSGNVRSAPARRQRHLPAGEEVMARKWKRVSATESVSPCRIEGYAFRPPVPASKIS